MWAEWIELKENLAKFQAERGNEKSNDKGFDDMTSKAERKRNPDASPGFAAEARLEVSSEILSLTC